MKSELEKLRREIAAIKSNHGGSSKKLRYPDKIKDSARRLFKSQSEFGTNGFANEIGISSTAMVAWLRESAKGSPNKMMIPLKVQTTIEHAGKQKPSAVLPPRVTIIVIEGDEAGLQLDRIFRSLKITDQLTSG